MEREAIEASVLRHLRKAMEREDANLTMELLGEDGISSIEAMELLSGLENEFKIRISPRSLRRVVTAMDLADLIEEKIN